MSNHRRLDQPLDIETPELVQVTYTVAGIGSRAVAAVIDYAICFAALGACYVVMAIVGERRRIVFGQSGAVAMAILILWQFLVLWGYYVLWEALADGQTPGKKRVGLRVVRDGGFSVGASTSAVRNLLRIVDMQPVITYAVGLTSIVASRTGKRLGDIVAGTIVVREAVTEVPAAIARRDDAAVDAAARPEVHAVLSEEEFTVLARFVERRNTLPPERREALAAQVAVRLAAPLAEVKGGSTTERLGRLHARELGARARGAAARGATGARRERHAIIATGSSRWIAFASQLARARKKGLAALSEEEVRTFVADYRDLAADLARLRTATGNTPNEEVFYLGRLVSSAHNLLYRRTRSFGEVATAIFVSAPREVRHSWRPVLLAAVMLFLPAAIAYTAVVTHPQVAPVFIEPQMLDRAEDGLRRAKAGEGYITDPQLFRPVMASSIIANNVQVAFGAFAFGVAAGLGTTYMLVFNGVHLGGVLGLYASKGILSLILAFVAPHGVIELAAICIAGGAGLLIGAALLVPGPRSRRRALVENGRRAIRLVCAAAVMLLVAGVIEGFISPIEWWPLEWKASVSVLTAVALWFYLRGGRAAARPEVAPHPAAPAVDLLALAAERQMAPRDLSSR